MKEKTAIELSLDLNDTKCLMMTSNFGDTLLHIIDEAKGNGRYFALREVYSIT